MENPHGCHTWLKTSEIERNIEENIDLRLITRENLEKTLKKLENKIKQRIDSDPVGYNKAVDILNKTVDSLPANVDAALQKCLCSFGKTVTQVCNQILSTGTKIFNYIGTLSW